jgi:hypothetical protein
MPVRNLPYLQQFWEHVIVPTDLDLCWDWNGSVKKGRPTIRCFRSSGKYDYEYGYRIAYRAMVGPIPEGLEICHNCNNPICCNPRHLRADTKKSNARDRTIAGTTALQKIKVDDLPVIRARLIAGDARNSIALDYGVSRSTIQKIFSGRSFNGH